MGGLSLPTFYLGGRGLKAATLRGSRSKESTVRTRKARRCRDRGDRPCVAAAQAARRAEYIAGGMRLDIVERDGQLTATFERLNMNTTEEKGYEEQP